MKAHGFLAFGLGPQSPGQDLEASLLFLAMVEVYAGRLLGMGEGYPL